MKKKTIGIIAAVAALIIAALAVVLIIMNSKIDSMRLLDYQDVHLGEIMAADIEAMQIGSYNHPTEKRSVTDEALRNELLDELREYISHGSFQKASGPAASRNPGDGAFSTIILTTADGKEFSFTETGGALKLVTPYGSGWYYSSVLPGVRRIVWKAEQGMKAQD